MALTVTPLDKVGVEVGGFDITKPIDAELAAELVSLWDEHGILLFRGQDVNPENQIAFSRIFGELEMHPLGPGWEAVHLLSNGERLSRNG